MLSEEAKARFWAKVDKSGECWLWTASVFQCSGYGQFRVAELAKRSFQTHRISWLLATGTLPGRSELIGHHCGNRLCVRPAHLFHGYQKPNRWGTSPSEACVVCGAPSRRRSMCSKHYQEWKATDAASPACSVVECEKKAYGLGLCRHHYGKAYRTNPDRPKCEVDGCERRTTCRGYCKMHHTRVLLEGAPGEATARRAPNGSGCINPNGYRLIHVRGVPMLEHRAIMAQVVGRALLDHEEVHHRNGDRADNRPENLELWSTSQPSGQRVGDKVIWAKEILGLYAPEVLR